MSVVCVLGSRRSTGAPAGLPLDVYGAAGVFAARGRRPLTLAAPGLNPRIAVSAGSRGATAQGFF